MLKKLFTKSSSTFRSSNKLLTYNVQYFHDNSSVITKINNYYYNNDIINVQNILLSTRQITQVYGLFEKNINYISLLFHNNVIEYFTSENLRYNIQ